MKKKIIPLAAFLCILLMLGAAVSSKPQVNRSACVGCGDCVKNCPTGAISLRGERAVIDQTLCIDCGFCVKTCNYNAVRRAK
jgi:ferredoxin